MIIWAVWMSLEHKLWGCSEGKTSWRLDLGGSEVFHGDMARLGCQLDWPGNGKKAGFKEKKEGEQLRDTARINPSFKWWRFERGQLGVKMERKEVKVAAHDDTLGWWRRREKSPIGGHWVGGGSCNKEDPERTTGYHGEKGFQGCWVGGTSCHLEGGVHQEIWVHEFELQESFGMRYRLER